MSHLVMFSRTTCGLCDRAREVILAQRDRVAFAYQEVFIDGDEDLEREYGLRVPVVEIDGAVAFEAEVEPVELARLLSAKPSSE